MPNTSWKTTDDSPLAETWADTFDEGGRGMHTNFDSSGGGIPVV